MKKCSKKIILLVAIINSTFNFTLVVSAHPIPERALNSATNEKLSISSNDIMNANGEIHLDADIIGWRYKSVNGQMYQRQYNYTKVKWIGEWELC